MTLNDTVGPEASKTSIGDQINALRRQRRPMEKRKVNFVDDMSMIESLNLATTLVRDTIPHIPWPVRYSGRLSLWLPKGNNLMQDKLDKLQLYTKQYMMSVSQKKNKV